MKKCPYCAEEIQDAAIVCKHCGRALTAVQPASAPVPYPVPAQPAAALPVNPNLSLAMQKYTQKGYKLLSAAGDTAVLERPAAEFSSCLFGWLFFLFGVGSLVYLFIYYVWAIRKAYRVQLSIGPNGQVQELGNTLEEFERDRTRAHRNRCIGFGLVLGIVGGLMLLLCLLALAMGPSGDMTWAEHLTNFTLAIIFFALPALLPGVFLLWRASKVNQKLSLRAV